jgi:hypothetical protein
MSMLLESSYTRRAGGEELRILDKAPCDLHRGTHDAVLYRPRSFYIRKDDDVQYGVISNQKDFLAQALKPQTPVGIMMMIFLKKRKRY